MLQYYHFLMKILARKKSFPIIFIGFCGFFSFMLLVNLNYNDQTTQRLFPIGTLIGWFPFVFAIIFVLFGIIQIYKNSEDDSTNLLLSSKPILRIQIVMARFLAIFSLIFIFSIFSLIFYFGIAHVDSFASIYEKFMFALSMTLGGLIVSTIVATIVIFMASIFGAKGVIGTTILFSSIIPPISFLAPFFSNSISPFDSKKGNMQGTYLSASDSSNDSNLDKFYEPVKDSKHYSGENIYVFIDNDQTELLRKVKNSAFKQAKFTDLWYQWGRFYSLALPSHIKLEKQEGLFSLKRRIKQIDFDELSANKIKQIIQEVKKTAIGENFIVAKKVIQKNNEVAMLFQKDEIEFEKNVLPSLFNENRYKELTKNGGILASELRNIDSDIEMDFKNLKIKNWGAIKKGHKFLEKEFKTYMKKLFGIRGDMPSKYYRILLWRAIRDYQNNQVKSIQTQLDNNSINEEQARAILNDKFSGLNQGFTYYALFRAKIYSEQVRFYIRLLNNELSIPDLRKIYFIVKNFEESDYITTQWVAIFWSVASALFLLISALIYMKRDFK